MQTNETSKTGERTQGWKPLLRATGSKLDAGEFSAQVWIIGGGVRYDVSRGINFVEVGNALSISEGKEKSIRAINAILFSEGQPLI